MSRVLSRYIARHLTSCGGGKLCRPGSTRDRRVFGTTTRLAFNWEDPLESRSLLTEEEIAIAETAESYCQEKLLPRVLRS